MKSRSFSSWYCLILLLMVPFCLFSTFSLAQDNPGGVAGPGWFVGKAEPLSPDQADAYLAARSSEMAFTQTETGQPLEGPAYVSPEIQELARALRNDPKLIYDYVHNHIDYVPYFGSLKGATLTYIDGNGNDFDQASLMIALLRAAGYTAQYVYGKMTIPGDQIANWLGVDQTQAAIQSVIWNGGGGATVGSDGTAEMNRLWVKATINGSDYLFDPAFKSYADVNKIDVGQALGYNQSNLLASFISGATVTADYVQNLNEMNLKSTLASYASSLVNTIRGQYPNQDVNQLYSSIKKVQKQG